MMPSHYVNQRLDVLCVQSLGCVMGRRHNALQTVSSFSVRISRKIPLKLRWFRENHSH
ncbi:hypothetical protein Mapa_007467 [Marchantia paleacea]|nr:hypothetical protein Mapa_007467 [Marchantia paleacea]